MKQARARSMSIVVVLLALMTTGPAALASESDAQAGEPDGSAKKTEPAPEATSVAETDPLQVCEPSKDTAGFNTLEDLYVGAAADLLSLIVPVSGVGVAQVPGARPVGTAQAAHDDSSVVWRAIPRD